MRICDLVTGMGRLRRASAQLRERWADTKQYWNDETARQFEERYLVPLDPKLTLTLAAVGRLAEVLEQAERDCEDERSEL